MTLIVLHTGHPVIPTDEFIFFKGVAQPPNQTLKVVGITIIYKPSMTWNGEHILSQTTPDYGMVYTNDLWWFDWEMAYYCYTHIKQNWIEALKNMELVRTECLAQLVLLKPPTTWLCVTGIAYWSLFMVYIYIYIVSYIHTYVYIYIYICIYINIFEGVQVLELIVKVD